MSDDEKASLATLRRGEVIEKFDAAMDEVAADILDPTKKPEATREVTLKLKIVPDRKREQCAVEIDVQTKLAKSESEQTVMYVGQKLGTARFEEYDRRQPGMFDSSYHEEAHDSAAE